MPPAVPVSRRQVLAYRLRAQQLDRSASSPGELAVLELGLQEAMGQPADYAVAARVPGPARLDVGIGRPLALVWSFRGAPHVHRRESLDALAGALYPLSEADAAGRLNETGPSVARAGIPALEQYALAVEAMRAVVDHAAGKGDVSTAVTQRLPAPMRRACRACRTEHISDSAMRVASLAAGVELEPGTNPPVLVRRPRARAPRRPDHAALRGLVTAYLRLLGPAGVGEAAGFLDARRADVAALGTDGLVEVDVDGERRLVPEERVEALRNASPPAGTELVRLLGPFDTWLQARDRDLIVPERAVQKTLWPVLGRPGALLVDGEVVGAWRTRTSGRRLTITVEEFAPLPPPVWDAAEAEAERVRAVRGASAVTLARS